MHILRPYQEESVVSIFNYFVEKRGNPVVGLPTGTGKSLVIAEFIRRALALYPQTRVLVVTHVKELIVQNFQELMFIWPTAPAGVYSAGLKRRDIHLPITFCGIASINRHIEDFGHIDLVLVDECHLISDKAEGMYQKSITALLAVNPLLKVVGLTATGYRMGTGLLTDGKLFTDFCVDYCTLDKFNSLVDDGYISPLIPKRTDVELDVEDVAIQGGEYVQQALQAAVDKETITRGAVKEAVELSRGRRHYLVFCTGTKHADHTRDMLIEYGIPAVSVHSDLPGGDAERTKNIALFKSGMVGAMCGVNVFTTGFNFRPVDCIIVLRPTRSPSLWVQMLGRGTRPSPETGKKDCLVLDFAANTRRLGPINDPVLPRKKGKKNGSFVPFKTCPKCNTYNHTRARFCICCKFEFPENYAATTQAASDELIRRKEALPPTPPETPLRVETHNVDRVEFEPHYSRDPNKPPSLRVAYICGLRLFTDYLCLEHPGFPSKKARDVWRQMESVHSSDGAPPKTIEEAMNRLDELVSPTQIRVLMKPKYPEIVGYDFTGGTQVKTLQQQIEDDDIPF